MPYDSSLDQSLFSKAQESEAGRLTVSVYSYNQGVKKLQISREIRDAEGGFKFSKLGRMTKDEIGSILPLIQEAVKHMD